MTDLLLSPHNDDAELFAAYQLLRYRPHVIVCLRSQVQHDRGTGITAAQREAETDCAIQVLGCSWEQWIYTDDAPAWPQIQHRLEHLAHLYDGRIFAPAVEDGGHDQHNRIGQLALDSFGPKRVTGYMTYRRGHGRSTSGCPVTAEPEWPALKAEALACYRSQIAEPTTAPWFVGDLTEYLAAA